jgi:hypothetical protein
MKKTKDYPTVDFILCGLLMALAFMLGYGVGHYFGGCL